MLRRGLGCLFWCCYLSLALLPTPLLGESYRRGECFGCNDKQNLDTKKMELQEKKFELIDDISDVLLADVKFSNLLLEPTIKMMNDIHEKREKIIAKRLKEILGIDLNIEEESKRRFKRLGMEINGNEETIYFNDGSINGIRIVTFVKKESPISFEIDRCQINVEYTYY